MLMLLLQIGFLLGTLSLCIIFHELGHFAYFYYLLKKKVKIHVKKGKLFFLPYKLLVGSKKDYESMSWKQYRSMTSWGIYAGFIPILLLLVPLVVFDLLVYVFLLYVLGSVKDITLILESFKYEKEE